MSISVLFGPTQIAFGISIFAKIYYVGSVMRKERVCMCFGLFGVGGGGHPPRPAHIPPKVTAAK